MRRHNSSPFRLPYHSYAEYQVISDYSDTSNDESHSTGVTNPCGILHPRSSFKRSHDAPGWARSQMSLRSNGQPGPRARCVKSYDTGRGRRERGRKIDGTDKLLFKEITFTSLRARGTSSTRKSTTSPGSWMAAGNPRLFPLRAEIGGRWLVKLIRVKWSLNGTRIDC